MIHKVKLSNGKTLLIKEKDNKLGLYTSGSWVLDISWDGVMVSNSGYTFDLYDALEDNGEDVWECEEMK